MTDEKPNVLVATRLTLAEFEALKDYAAEADRSVAWLLRQWIRAHLEPNEAAA